MLNRILTQSSQLSTKTIKEYVKKSGRLIQAVKRQIQIRLACVTRRLEARVCTMPVWAVRLTAKANVGGCQHVQLSRR